MAIIEETEDRLFRSAEAGNMGGGVQTLYEVPRKAAESAQLAFHHESATYRGSPCAARGPALPSGDGDSCATTQHLPPPHRPSGQSPLSGRRVCVRSDLPRAPRHTLRQSGLAGVTRISTAFTCMAGTTAAVGP